MTDDELDNAFRSATSLRDAGDLAGARRTLEGLAEQHPEVFGIWLVLGGVQLSQADYVAAERSFAAAVSLRPRSELASLGTFHTLKYLGRVDDAFAEMRRFLALRPKSKEYALLLAEMEAPQLPPA